MIKINDTQYPVDVLFFRRFMKFARAVKVDGKYQICTRDKVCILKCILSFWTSMKRLCTTSYVKTNKIFFLLEIDVSNDIFLRITNVISLWINNSRD